jgi:NAD(P)-dependent dehydrogenase (short-subunit alcohol dehydrogenase family)
MSRQEAVFITGGASGIGFAIVEAVLEQGWRAMIADHNEQSLDRSRETLARHGEQARFLQLDITNEDEVTQIVGQSEAEFGPLPDWSTPPGLRGICRPSRPALISSAEFSMSMSSAASWFPARSPNG